MKALNLHLIASKDDLRPALNYIKLESMDTIVVTNGHILLKSDFETIFGINPQIVEDETLLHNVVNSGILIHRDEYKKIANKMLIDYVETDEERQEIRFRDNKQNVYVVKYEKGNKETFPDWRSVYREWTDFEPIDGIAFGLPVLESLVQCLKPVKIQSIGMRFKNVNGSVALKIRTIDANEITGVVMPVRWLE